MEPPAHQILQALQIFHIPYETSTEEEIACYLSAERKQWLEDFGDVIVHSKLITSEEISMVTFEEFFLFCSFYGLNPYEKAQNIDRTFYLQMQIADYILNNNDRHEQNWGFLMDNATGKLIGYCPLFDHDHAFSSYERIYSQTTELQKTLREAAQDAQKELQMDLQNLFFMEQPQFLSKEQWNKVLERAKHLTE